MVKSLGSYADMATSGLKLKIPNPFKRNWSPADSTPRARKQLIPKKDEVSIVTQMRKIWSLMLSNNAS